MHSIFITGGHLTPAMAVASALQQNGRWRIYYLGRKHSLEGDPALSAEYLTLKRNPSLTFLAIISGRLQRNFTRFTLPSLLKIPVGLIQSFYWLVKFRPSLVLSFGGYVALPVVIASWVLGLPVLTHEQTAVPGLSNRIIGFLARKILLTWPDSDRQFPSNKTLVVGNPLRPEIFQANSTEIFLAFQKMQDKHQLPTLYITGGNQGAQSVNEIILEALPELLADYLVVHAVGVKNFSDVERFRAKLPEKLREKYFPFDFIHASDIGWVLNSAAVIIGRAGANTVLEIAALGKVAILIPLPWSGGGEQNKNADMLIPYGATILPQDKLSAKTLIGEIRKASSDFTARQKLALQAKNIVNFNATAQIVAEVEKAVYRSKK